MLELDIRSPRRVGRLLQKHRIARDLADVDGDLQPLAGEDAVHERDVLVGEIAADGEDQDARLEGGTLGWVEAVVAAGVDGGDGGGAGGGGDGGEEGLFVRVG